MGLECYDLICQTVEYHAGEGDHPVYPDQKVQNKPGADHPAEAERERQYPYHRNVLQNFGLPGRRCNGIYQRRGKC